LFETSVILKIATLMCILLHVQHPLLLQDFHEIFIFSKELRKKDSNIKLHENPSSGSRVLLYGQTDGQTGITKLIDAFLILRTHLGIATYTLHAHGPVRSRLCTADLSSSCLTHAAMEA
jgi:hypothetical protein